MIPHSIKCAYCHKFIAAARDPYTDWDIYGGTVGGEGALQEILGDLRDDEHQCRYSDLERDRIDAEREHEHYAPRLALQIEEALVARQKAGLATGPAIGVYDRARLIPAYVGLTGAYLSRKEATMTGITPAHEAGLIRAVEDHAARWAHLDPVRYVADGWLDAQERAAAGRGRAVPSRRAVWEWVARYIAEHPEVLTWTPPTYAQVAERERAAREQQEARAREQATEVANRAHAAFKAGRYSQALELLNEAERLDPYRRDWEALRDRVRAAREETGCR